MMFCHVLSCSVCCLFVTGNLSDEHWLHWLGFCVAFCWVCGFVSLLLFACFLASVACTAVRRALCLRRPRRRVGCSGQAVPCLVLRRCQQAVLVYMRFCWWSLMHVDANVGSWCCMLMHADACWSLLMHLNSCSAWSLLTASFQQRCGGTLKPSCGLSLGFWHRIALKCVEGLLRYWFDLV